MMTRLFFCFQIVGGVVCVVSGSVGAVLLLVWLADVALTRVLRATKTFGIVIRFAWLEGNKKQQLKDDLAEEERQRKLPPPAPVPETDDELDEPRWFYAHDREAEHWQDACSKTREEAIEEARHHLEWDDDVIYVVLGQRPTTADLAACVSADWILDNLIDHASDDGLLGDSDDSIRWTSRLDFEAELSDLVARHISRPRWWCCDGSLAEAVTKTPEPPAGSVLDSDTLGAASSAEQSRSADESKTR